MNKKYIIWSIVGLAFILLVVWIISIVRSSQHETQLQDETKPPAQSNNTSSNSNNTNNQNVNTNTTPKPSEIGKTAYANKSGVKVYNSQDISIIYKTASNGEFIGQVLDIKSPAGSTQFYLIQSPGGKVIVNKSNVTLK